MSFSYVMNRMGEGTTGDTRGAGLLMAAYMAMATAGQARSTSGSAGGPGEEVVGGHRVDDPLDRHPAFGGAIAAVRLPLELAGGVRVGVDREPAAVLDRHVEQLAVAGRGAPVGS